MDTYADKAARCEREIAQLEADTHTNPVAIQARLASLRRSLRWYRTRDPLKTRRVSTLSTTVGDDIASHSALG